MEKENKLTYIDEKGNEVLCEVLFTFDSDEFKKSYVLFYPVGSEDEEGNVEVMAACYKLNENGEAGDLENIEDEKEWDLVEEMLESFANEDDEYEIEDEEECSCDCDSKEDCECSDNGECECEEKKEEKKHCCCKDK